MLFDDQPDPPAPGLVQVVDAHSLIFQVFHAIPNMTSPRGEPVNAVYGFTRDLLFLLEQRPECLICAFDPPGDTFRHEIYSGYKADRGEMPDELRSQIPKIRAVVEAFGIPVLSVPNFEADDVLATIARLCDERGVTCHLVSGDKDCRQLLTRHVSILNIRKNELYTAETLLQDWGVRPEQVIDFQALVGDSVDRVPGVPGIGPKTATELLSRFETLEGVLANAPLAKGARTQKALVEHRDSAILSRRLVELDRYVPLEFDWENCRVGGQQPERLAELFTEFGFRGLADRALKMVGANEPESSGWDADYRIVDTPEKLAAMIDALSSTEVLSIDTETTALNPRAAELVGLSFCAEPGVAYYVPLRAPSADRAIPTEIALAALRPLYENPAVSKIGQNLKYDLTVLRGAGVEVAGVAFDTMVASYLLDAGERIHSLDELSARYLNHTTIKISELIGKGKSQKRMDEVPVAKIGPYAAEDADVPMRLMPLLAERLDQQGLSTLHDDVETPLVEVLAEMEYYGIKVDAQRLSELSERFGKRLKELEEQIEEIAGHPFNIASPKQLAEVLFQELKLPVLKKTKTGASTDAEVLEELAEKHPLPRLIVEHRQYSKLKGTYVDALPELILPATGRVHCSFNQVVAATGRLSCSDPNLQNIPIRTAEGKEIRSAFVAGAEGWKLLTADYSQIELRVLAHYTQDETLCGAFARGEDIHTLVASQVNGVTEAEVTPAMRRGAKAVNFGIIYGQSPFGLAKSLGISKEEAARFIAEYFARYPGVEQFMLDTLNFCRENGYVETILGRRRAIDGVRKPAVQAGNLFNRQAQPLQLNLPERTAVNTVIQGSAADIIKLAMLHIHRRLKSEGLESKMILQVHDELVFDCPEVELETLTNLVRDEMQSALLLHVPLQVDINTGATWAECH